jgi:hypothetical protein
MNYRQLVSLMTQGAPVLRAKLGSAFVGVMHGLFGDIIAEGATQAIRMPWMEDAQPVDALALLAKERGMPRYRHETILTGNRDQYDFVVVGPNDLTLWSQYQSSALTDRLFDQGSPNVQPKIYQTLNLPAAMELTLSVETHRGTTTRQRDLRIELGTNMWARFAHTTSGDPLWYLAGYENCTATCTSIGSDWFRCAITGYPALASIPQYSGNVQLRMTDGVNLSYNGMLDDIYLRNVRVYRTEPQRLHPDGAIAHRKRLREAWQTQPYAGSKRDIIYHLGCAGYTDAYVGCIGESDLYFPCAGVSGGAPVWKYPSAASAGHQFAVYFPGPHPVRGPAKNWDDFNWDDGTLWDCQADMAGVSEIRAIIDKRRPWNWMCSDLMFNVAGTIVHLPY